MPENKQVKQDHPGAPLGNANHLKHGFYSRRFKGVIQQDLEGHSFIGLTDEITALRVFLRETLELISHPTNEKHALDCLRSLSGNDTNSLLDQAIEEIWQEWDAEEADNKASEQAAMDRLPKYGIFYPWDGSSVIDGTITDAEEGSTEAEEDDPDDPPHRF